MFIRCSQSTNVTAGMACITQSRFKVISRTLITANSRACLGFSPSQQALSVSMSQQPVAPITTPNASFESESEKERGQTGWTGYEMACSRGGSICESERIDSDDGHSQHLYSPRFIEWGSSRFTQKRRLQKLSLSACILSARAFYSFEMLRDDVSISEGACW